MSQHWVKVATIQNVPTHVQINVSALGETLRYSSRLQGQAEEIKRSNSWKNADQ
jgi:hypothetical protein